MINIKYIVPVDFIKTHNVEVDAEDEIEALNKVVSMLKKNKNKLYSTYNSYEIHNHKITETDMEGVDKLDDLSHLF